MTDQQWNSQGDQEKLQRGTTAIRDACRIIGPIILGVGVIFMIVGFVDLVGVMSYQGPPDFHNSHGPKRFWCFFVGMPLLFVGLVITGQGFMSAAARFQASQIAPLGKDVTNYMVDGTKDSIKTIGSALGAGLAEGMGQPTGEAEAGQVAVRCHKCNNPNPADAKFCSDCGAALTKSKPCPACHELNDPDARFCDNCGGTL